MTIVVSERGAAEIPAPEAEPATVNMHWWEEAAASRIVADSTAVIGVAIHIAIAVEVEEMHIVKLEGIDQVAAGVETEVSMRRRIANRRHQHRRGHKDCVVVVEVAVVGAGPRAVVP